jgi:pre-mRNA-processing factor SLU7
MINGISAAYVPALLLPRKSRAQPNPNPLECNILCIFRKGACENCGALTHKTKECTERPRGKGARWTKKDISSDEVVQDVSGLGYAGKRDRWNGYDANGHVSMFQRFEALEEQRKEVRQQLIEDKLLKGETDALEEDEARDTLGDATIGQKVMRC